jgi:hypothetical protein
MKHYDPEIDDLRERVNCSFVLETSHPPWRLDRKQTSKACRKYRRGKGEILIVNNGGKGWWDPHSERKGDVFTLVQFLDPSLNFGEVRKVLRPLAGLSPVAPAKDEHEPKNVDKSIGERWTDRPRIETSSLAWRYLSESRGLPVFVLCAARAADVLRDGAYGSPWFAHHDGDRHVTHVEIRGPNYKGSLRGGAKTLFRLPGSKNPLSRLVVTEGAIDALSIAALESIRADTLYAATGGGMSPRTLTNIADLLTRLAAIPDGLICSAADANAAGERYAARHQQLATNAGVAFQRLSPPVPGGDWNDALKHLAEKGLRS